MTRYAMLAAMAALMISCSPSIETQTATDGCDWTREITVSHDDKLTAETAEEIVAHNRARQKECG